MKNRKLGSGMAGMVVLSVLLTACGEDGPPHVFECEDCPESTDSFLEATVNGPGGPGNVRLDDEHEDVSYLALHYPNASRVVINQFQGVALRDLEKGIGFAFHLPKGNRLPITMPVAHLDDDAGINSDQAHFFYSEFMLEGDEMLESALSEVEGTITVRTFDEGEIRGEFSVQGRLLDGPFRGSRDISGTFVAYGGTDFSGDEP